jgi:hypothetical protein
MEPTATAATAATAAAAATAATAATATTATVAKNTVEQKDSIVESVIRKFQERSAVGIKKYGVTLDRTDLGVADWIQHAQEELMDAILYLEKLKQAGTEAAHK